MKRIFAIMLVILLFPTYCLAQGEESFALIDWGNNKVVILDFSGNILFEKDFDGIGVCYFISPSVDGWLVKGCLTSGCWGEGWIIWQLQPDGSITNSITGLGPGPFYTGIEGGNFITGNVYTGVIDLYNESGAIINSINVWEEEEGLPYDYSRLGDTASLVSGGFVVPPQGGWPSIGQLYTPYLYYYDNNLNLINALDITSVDMRLLNMTGLSDGGFAGTCAAHGTGYDVESLCWFNSEGGLIETVDVTSDLPFRDYMNVFVAGLSDARIMVTVYGQDKVWIYDPPSSGGSFLASQPEVLDLSGAGVSAIGGIAGNILMLDSECEGDLDCDGDVDAEDVTAFLVDFGRGGYNSPCTNEDLCKGDFDCDGNVDADDVSKFLEDFGRDQYVNPCPACVAGDWCNYSEVTTTTTAPTTTSIITTTIPPECELTISSSSETVYTWETVQFGTTLSGDCNAPCYDWEVLTSVGSTIDSDGLYTAGGTAGIDTVTATDNCNEDISDSAIVEVVFPTTTVPPTTTTTAP